MLKSRNLKIPEFNAKKNENIFLDLSNRMI